jgi:hypothetical protein
MNDALWENCAALVISQSSSCGPMFSNVGRAKKTNFLLLWCAFRLHLPQDRANALLQVA